MRNPKQHHTWKSNDERRKRSTLSSGQGTSKSTNNNSPANYSHEKKHAGIEFEEKIQMSTFWRRKEQDKLD